MTKSGIISAFAHIVAALCSGQSAQSPFSLTVSIAQQNPRDIRLNVTLTNVSGSDFHIATKASHVDADLDYEVTVLDDHGEPARYSDYGKKVHGKNSDRSGSIIARVIKPGRALQESADLSRIFDLSKPGNYAVSVKKFDAVSKTVVISNTVILSVSP